MEGPTPRILGKQVWCIDCIDKIPPMIRVSDFLIPARKGHYDLCPDELSVDRRVVGVCDDCLESKNDFQKRYAIDVDIEHKHLVYKNA